MRFLLAFFVGCTGVLASPGLLPDEQIALYWIVFLHIYVIFSGPWFWLLWKRWAATAAHQVPWMGTTRPHVFRSRCGDKYLKETEDALAGAKWMQMHPGVFPKVLVGAAKIPVTGAAGGALQAFAARIRGLCGAPGHEVCLVPALQDAPGGLCGRACCPQAHKICHGDLHPGNACCERQGTPVARILPRCWWQHVHAPMTNKSPPSRS